MHLFYLSSKCKLARPAGLFLARFRTGVYRIMTTYFSYPASELQAELKRTAEEIVAPGKGILAVDETNEDIGKLLAAAGLKNKENNRRRYRQLLFTTDNLSEHVSATILFDETVHQKTDDGTLFIDVLKKKKIIPGIKLVTDTVPLFLSEAEVTTQGLHDLANRCASYKKLGCRFAKWRCPLKFGEHTPPIQAISDMAQVLARYAAICQSEGLVPLVEPDVLLDGILFLSGSQSEEEATLNLNAINRVQLKKLWVLTFSYGRALQASVWKTWAGKDENTANGLASRGKYEASIVTSSAAGQSNFRKNYKY